MFSIIVAIGRNNEIGKGNRLLWHIPEDLRNFRKITLGKTVIMGRKTFESIGKALPERKNIVLSRSIMKEEAENKGFEVYGSIEELIGDFKDSQEEVFIIGGEKIYKEILKRGIVDRLYISHINFSDSEADAYFPEIEYNDWEIVQEKEYEGWEFKIYVKKEIDNT